MRYNYPKREVFSRVLDGAVGDINAMYSTYNAEVGGSRGRAITMSDLEIQMRLFKHLWLAGDSIVEQAVHSIDMMQWAMGEELPIEAEGSGGRQVYPEMIPTAMVIFTITLPSSTSGQMVHGDTISHAARAVPRRL